MSRNARPKPFQKMLKSTADPRVTNLVRLGGGEGYATFTAEFRDQPALLVDNGTMNDFLGEEDKVKEPVGVWMFESVEERDAFAAKTVEG